jgi:hypothetical protein
MLKTGLKFFLVIMIVLTTYNCIDPYFPRLNGYQPVLVVDGLITNDNRAYTVKLSYTVQQRDSTPVKVSDATVSITDEAGVNTQLTAFGNGIYRTDSLNFRGETGKTYRLHIKTSNGNEYVSDSCTMLPVPGIDSIYFAKDVQLLNNQSTTREGISIYLDTKAGTEDKSFLRWAFDETWEFKVPDPTRYTYINDSTILTIPGSEVMEYCWKSASSTTILTGAILTGGSGSIKNQPIQFIAPELSDRISVRYSILIKQYSVSQSEYDYWNNLEQISETEGDIFGSQPYAVLSNIKNIKNSSEQVLGYFQVSAVDQRRKFISIEETIPLGLPFYNYVCTRIVTSPSDWSKYNPWRFPAMTFDELYQMYATTPGYAFVEPVYDATTNKLAKLVFTSSECADCELTGTRTQPDFWTDK